jgi:chromodomain-helicase-DNA-binding protein 6
MGVFVLQKRRSGRQVKRRKYNEDLDFKVVDDDGETIAVLGAGRTSALSASTLAWQAEVRLLHEGTYLG